MQFSVLSTSVGDFAKWSSFIQKLPPEDRDIHFLPEYGRIYQKTYGYEPCLAYYEDGNNFVIQPFVKRPLNGLPFLKEQKIEELYYDIANAYGYGGPVRRCDDPHKVPQLLIEFDRHFSTYCRELRIASEFTSLHPLLYSQRVLLDLDLFSVSLQKEVVYVDLSRLEAEIWANVRKGHKSSIRKAEKSGVRIEKVEPKSRSFDILNRLYYDTMERNKAANRWYFPEDYFRECHEQLGKERVSLFVALVGSVPAAACIVMHDFYTVYYHFSGSDDAFFNYCTNNLMVYKVALWAKEKGYKYFSWVAACRHPHTTLCWYSSQDFPRKGHRFTPMVASMISKLMNICVP